MNQIFDLSLRHIHCQAWMSPKPKADLHSLNPVLSQLAWVHDEYVTQQVYPDQGNQKLGDCTFWYSERPQVGLFAAAVWKSGGIALEEFGTTKSAGGVESRGRGDLFFKLGEIGYVCEAKHIWLSLSDQVSKNLKHFKRQVEESSRDVKKHPELDRKLALTFAATAIEVEDNQNPHTLLKELGKNIATTDVVPNAAVLALSLRSGPMKGKKDDRYAHYALIVCAQLVG